jgi:hypothetical protein
MKLGELFGSLFTIGPKRREANKAILALDRWFLEFVRNTLAVSVLFAVAEKSGRWYLYGFAYLAGLDLWGTIYAHLDPIVANARLVRNKVVTSLLILLAVVLVAVPVYALSSTLVFIITELVRVQTAKKATTKPLMGCAAPAPNPATTARSATTYHARRPVGRRWTAWAGSVR